MGIGKLASLTCKDRILLYLTEYRRMEERYELPSDLTQESIAEATGIQRKHLPQYLKDLIADGLLVQRKAHIKGMKQRMNGYYLSRPGFSKASAIRDEVGATVVPVQTAERVVEMKVSDIDEATSVHITYCDIVTEALKRGELKMESLEAIESERMDDLEKKDEATHAYRRALVTAWRDGKVTSTERFLIEELRMILKISEERHRLLEGEILKKLAEDHMGFLRIYGGVLEIALADGHLHGPEVDILEKLRKMLRISRQEHGELVKEITYELFGPPRDVGEDRILAD